MAEFFFSTKNFKFLKTLKLELFGRPFSLRNEYPSVPHTRPQFNTSVPHKDHTFSAPKNPQFNTKNPSVQHQNPWVPHQKLLSSTPKSLSSTPKTPQFNTKSIGSTPKAPQFHLPLTAFLVWNWGVFGVEPRGFWCGTEGCLLWNWGILELKRIGPFVWNWCVELKGTPQKSISESKRQLIFRQIILINLIKQ